MADICSEICEQKLPHVGPRWTQKKLVAVSLLCSLGMMIHGGFLTHKHLYEEGIRVEYTSKNCTWWTAEKAFVGNEILSMGCTSTRKFVITRTMCNPMLSYRLTNFDYVDSAVFNDTLKLYDPGGKCICDTSNPSTKATAGQNKDVCEEVGGSPNCTMHQMNIDEWHRSPMLRVMRRPWKRLVGNLYPGEYTAVIRDRYHMWEPGRRKFIDLHVDKWPGMWSHLLGPVLTAAGAIQTALVLLLGLTLRFRKRSAIQI